MLKKIAIVGAESTGKTYLSAQLAAYYDCLWVPEYAREFLENLPYSYTQHDVDLIAKGQINYEDVLARQSKTLLICDTNLLVIKVWMNHKFGNSPAWIEEEIANRKYDLHLLTAPDIPFEKDPLRENPELREFFFNEFKKLLTQHNFKFEIIKGDYNKRLKTAVKSVDGILN